MSMTLSFGRVEVSALPSRFALRDFLSLPARFGKTYGDRLLAVFDGATAAAFAAFEFSTFEFVHLALDVFGSGG
jgi:hypothetical protein